MLVSYPDIRQLVTVKCEFVVMFKKKLSLLVL